MVKCISGKEMSVGIWQLIIILVIVLVLFGRGKISQIMGEFGKGIKSFKKEIKSPEIEKNEPENQTEQK